MPGTALIPAPTRALVGATAYAYIRKSTTGDTDSMGDQIRNVTRLVPEADRATLTILTGDWGISAAREQTQRRLDFLRVIEDVGAGRVSHLYAYHTDRLARSVRWAAQLLDACADAGILITTTERTFDPRDPTTALVWNITATMNQSEVEKMKRKAADRVASMKGRIEAHAAECPGWTTCGVYHLHKLGAFAYGAKPGEDVNRVIDAFVSTGSFAKAAKVLNDDGIPTRHGARSWEGLTVQRIVQTQRNLLPANVILPRARRKGGHIVAVHVLSGLVRCPHDGSTLTATWRHVRSGREVGLFCRQGRNVSGHPSPYTVAERVIVGPVRDATTAYLQAMEPMQPVILDADGNVIEGVTSDPATTARLAALAQDREDVQAAIERATRNGRATAAYDAELRTIDADIERLTDEHSAVLARMPIDWSAPTAEVNARLHRMIDHIELGPTFRVAGIVWRDQPGAPSTDGTWTLKADSSDLRTDPSARPVDGGWLTPIEQVA